MSRKSEKSKSNDDETKANQPEVNISRVRRAIDFCPGFTIGEREVAGVIADHFNAEEGYAFPSYRYLEFVYGFSQATISSTVRKLRQELMTIDRSGGNNRYSPDESKVESVLARLRARRAEWKEEQVLQQMKRQSALGAKAGVRVLQEVKHGASPSKAPVLQEVKRNVQPKAQPKAQPSLAHLGDERDDFDFVETKLPENYASLSQRDQFDFAKAVYHSTGRRPPESDDVAWTVFCEIQKRGECLRSIVADIDALLDGAKFPGRTEKLPNFEEYLVGFISNEDEAASLLESLRATNDNRQSAETGIADEERPEVGASSDEDESVAAQESWEGAVSSEWDEWPKRSRTWSTIMAAGCYPRYPGDGNKQEIDLASAELEKLRGKVAFRDVLAAVRRYAGQRKDQNYKKTLKFSAFLAQMRWDVEGDGQTRAANENRKLDRVGGDGSSYGGKCDPSDPF
ncbi:hypothetical protein ABH975_002346 [Bradyrhizobium ottawaense]|uniref:hypothetical protein n=1 Tax=Bradyrhizobium ottawaense TaxID=931866 RepID=UPI0035172981